MKAYGFIYITTNTVNNKRYIGQCVYHKRKNWEHYLGSGKYLLMAIKKYGKHMFTREIICNAFDQKELNLLEQQFIAEYNASNDSTFYNIALGGQVTNGFKGKKHTEEYKKKRSTDLLKSHPRKGMKMPPGWGMKSGNARRGKSFHTLEQLEKIRQTGRLNRGKTVSKETKERMRAAKIGYGCITWIVVSPSGETTIVENLPQFCIDNNVSKGMLYASGRRGTPSRTGWYLTKYPTGK